MAYRYLAAGFSILPVDSSKRPYAMVLPQDDSGRRRWEQWTLRPPSPAEVEWWFRKAPDAGIGIILGEVSHWAYALDVDDGLFSNWLGIWLPNSSLGRTWCNKTGSGKVHVLVRAPHPPNTPTFSTLHDARDGRKLADIRGEAQYVVAPPSVYKATGARYSIWLGSPEKILVLSDPWGVWGALRDGYANGHQSAAPSTARSEGAALPGVGRILTEQPKHSTAILPPAIGADLAELQDAVSSLPSARGRRALLEGVEMGDKAWGSPSDWSGLDWQIVKELLKCGWSEELIERAWATFPIGQHTYQNRDRPNHGQAYLLDYTLPSAIRSLAEERLRIAKAEGANFKLLRALCIHYDKALYEFTFQRTTADPPTEHIVRMTGDQLYSEREFKKACFESMQWVVKLYGGHKGTGFEDLIDQISGMLENVYPPKGATEEGQLKEIVLKALRDRLDRSGAPERASGFGWIDRESKLAFVHGGTLMAHLREGMRHPPAPPKVWDILVKMGATSSWERVGERREQMWRIPAEMLL